MFSSYQATGFKQQREDQRKADAGNRAAWNSLFIRSDTVAEAVAAHYGISKGLLLDAEAADLPVRMALGEAQVRGGSGGRGEGGWRWGRAHGMGGAQRSTGEERNMRRGEGRVSAVGEGTWEHS